jgi:hypothetical protein
MLKKSKKVFYLLFLFLLTINISACVIAAAGAGAAATYSVTSDSVVDNNVKFSKEAIIEHFVDLIKEEKGMLLYVSISEGRVKAELGKKKLYLDVNKNDTGKTTVKLSVRKGYQLLPDKEEAMRIYKKLAISLND